MLTDYDIQKIATAVVDRLTADERFMRRMAELMPKRQNLVSSRTAASMLGISRKTVCEIAEKIGGIKGKGPSAHWLFEEDGLVERYIDYKNKVKL